MSEREESERGTDKGPESFRLPDREGDGERPRLRRRLLGASRGDVVAELAERDSELAELRRDVAALWLAFGQHERTLHQILVALERISGVEIDAPGGRSAERREPDPPTAAGAGEDGAEEADAYERAPRRQTAPEAEPSAPSAESGERPPRPAVGSISEQLSDLDDVLAAIEQATSSLERTYSSRLAETAGGGSGERRRGEGATDANGGDGSLDDASDPEAGSGEGPGASAEESERG